jgi:hypothetical protein
MKTVVTSVALAAFFLATPRSAHADANTAAAEAAFQRATKLRADGKWAEACDAFDQSNKLDPQFGTAFNLGGCYLQIKKLVAAWSVYSELAQKDTNAGRKAKSAELVAQLQPRLSWIKIEAPATKPDGFSVTVDGESAVQLLGVETPYEIGTHQVVATASGMETVTKSVVIESEGQHVSVVIPAMSPVQRAEQKQVAINDAAVEQIETTHGLSVAPSPWIVMASATAGVYSAPPGENAPAFAVGLGAAVGRRLGSSIGVIAAANADLVVDRVTFERVFAGAGIRLQMAKLAVHVTPGVSILTGASETVLGFGGDAVVSYAVTTKIGVALHVNASSVAQPEGFMGNLTLLRAGVGVSFQP